MSELRDRLRKALSYNGIDSTSGDIHSWRCEYYRDIDGPCGCLDELLDDLVAATSPEAAKGGGEK